MKKTLLRCFCYLHVFCAPLLFGQNTLDTTFDPGTGANAFVESTLVQPDGKILVCGLFTEFNGMPRRYIARLNSDGSVDPTFVANPNYWVRFMALQPDNKVVIGGFFTGVDGLSRNRVARLNENGSVDPTFNPGTGCEGRIVEVDPTQPYLFAIAVQTDGKIIIGGNFTNYNRIARSGVARLNPDGSLDTGFNVGTGVDSWVRSILILPNDQILLSGWFQNYNGHTHNRVVRLNPDGSADEALHPWFGYSTSVYSMSRQNDGNIVVGGHSVNTNAPFLQEVVRLLPDGSYDPAFNSGGEGANDKVESVVVQPDGKILIGGYFSAYNNTSLRGFARLNSDGTIDPSLNASADNWIWTVALQKDQKILICGAFSKINGISRNGIARLNPTDDYTPPPPPPPPQPAQTNRLEVWLMAGADLREIVGIPDRQEITNPDWQTMTVGDVNQDGNPDFLFQHRNGPISAWIMKGTNFLEVKSLRRKLRVWKMIGINDRVGDQKAQVIVQRSNGRLAVLYFKNSKFAGAAILPRSLVLQENWRLVGFSDFDGNQTADFLLQDAERRLVVWFMDKNKFLRSSYLDAGRPIEANLAPITMADNNGDGQRDILFQKDNGNPVIWTMTQTNIVSSSEMFPSPQITAGKKIVGSADFNQDGSSDLIWKKIP